MRVWVAGSIQTCLGSEFDQPYENGSWLLIILIRNPTTEKQVFKDITDISNHMNKLQFHAISMNYLNTFREEYMTCWCCWDDWNIRIFQIPKECSLQFIWYYWDVERRTFPTSTSIFSVCHACWISEGKWTDKGLPPRAGNSAGFNISVLHTTCYSARNIQTAPSALFCYHSRRLLWYLITVAQRWSLYVRTIQTTIRTVDIIRKKWIVESMINLLTFMHTYRESLYNTWTIRFYIP